MMMATPAENCSNGHTGPQAGLSNIFLHSELLAKQRVFEHFTAQS
jgi:hypothetical protein